MTHGDFDTIGFVALKASRAYRGEYRVVVSPVIRDEPPLDEWPICPGYRIGRVTLEPLPDPRRDAEWAQMDALRAGTAKPLEFVRRRTQVQAMQWTGTDDCRWALSEWYPEYGYGEMFPNDSDAGLCFYDGDSDIDTYVEIGDWLVCEDDRWFSLTTKEIQARYTLPGAIPDNVHLWASQTLAFSDGAYTTDERELVAVIVKRLLDSFAPKGQ